ncbi:MAG: nucleotidyl transferase AbiEii/AbiGii toxin family protein [Fibromonadaceae bacterium]|jgi:predicted nucleotidyltransferase component of viral defense system|nr:nucleotidyl transferase AbiEii/AbiGii toxin family protein [Fibromonadaceae bacterium]
MNHYDRAVIGRQAAELGFIRDSFEKVSRLAGLLSFFECDPILSQYLALKGGTAINMLIFKMPRLSVDIDLDFAENLPLEEMMVLRETIRNTIKLHMDMSGYTLTAKSKKYHALDSDVYSYINSAGVRDNIKIEINYTLRSHILPLVKRPIETLGIFAPTTVLSLDPVEIFASKIVALRMRAAARDLYDVSNMVNAKLFDKAQTEMLRKCIVFYSAIGSEVTPETLDFDKMDAFTYHDIKTKLKPMLRKKELFDFEAARKQVREYLSELIILSNDEKEFLASFRNGKYLPELLYSGETLERIRSHPMAMWKMRLH